MNMAHVRYLPRRAGPGRVPSGPGTGVGGNAPSPGGCWGSRGAAGCSRGSAWPRPCTHCLHPAWCGSAGQLRVLDMGKGRAGSSVQTAVFLINPRTKRRGSGGVPRCRSRLCLAPVLRAWARPRTAGREGSHGALPRPESTALCHRRPVRPRAPHPTRRAVTQMAPAASGGWRPAPVASWDQDSAGLRPHIRYLLVCLVPTAPTATGRHTGEDHSWGAGREAASPSLVLSSYLFTVRPLQLRCRGHQDTGPAPQRGGCGGRGCVLAPAGMFPRADCQPGTFLRRCRGTPGLSCPYRGGAFGHRGDGFGTLPPCCRQ